MVYKQLTRINELDTTIADLHQHLASLYQERANLLQPIMPAASARKVSLKPAAKLPKASATNLSDTYTGLQTAWLALGLTVPARKIFQQSLVTACGLVLQLERANPSLAGKVSVVAVPPFHDLQKALAGLPEPQAARFKFITPDSFNYTQRTKDWSLVVVIDPAFSLKIYGLQAFLDRQEFVYGNQDCRALGLQELLAAELQGVATVLENSWTVLLKDRPDIEGGVACVTLADGQLILRREDTDCLLGENYLRLAIAANPGSHHAK